MIDSKLRLLISIVSHGQGNLIKHLLKDLNNIDFSFFSTVKVILTINIPEDECYLDGFKLNTKIIRNLTPMGFGANHNQAFKYSDSDFFLILNPDLRILSSFSLRDLIETEAKGIVAPKVLNYEGLNEDNFRKYPTFINILRRVFQKKRNNDYFCGDGESICVDWVAGMFMLFNSAIFYKLSGFDESYFMYLEDADICYNFNKNNFPVVYTTSQYVIHDARRQTFKTLSHFKWHFSSMIRFIFKNRSFI